jgi:hypothetical protein
VVQTQAPETARQTFVNAKSIDGVGIIRVSRLNVGGVVPPAQTRMICTWAIAIRRSRKAETATRLILLWRAHRVILVLEIVGARKKDVTAPHAEVAARPTADKEQEAENGKYYQPGGGQKSRRQSLL